MKKSTKTPKPKQRRYLEPQDHAVFQQQERLLTDAAQCYRMLQAAQALLKQQIRAKYGLSDAASVVPATGEILD